MVEGFKAEGTYLLTASVLSMVSCLVVTISILIENKHTRSHHLSLVLRLLISNFLLSLVLVVYVAIVNYPGVDSVAVCNVFFPIPKYFFLVSYGWTIFIAIRFKDSNMLNQPDKTSSKYEMEHQKYWKLVWVVPFVLVLPTIISDIAFPGVISQFLNESSASACVYDHSVIAAITIDIVTFQAPIFITICVDMFFYSRGILALVRDTPQSVLARQMRRAGGYLLVLVIVWVPNLVYSIISISSQSNTNQLTFLDITLILASLQVMLFALFGALYILFLLNFLLWSNIPSPFFFQGFLNVCFYVYSNGSLRKWMLALLCCERNWLTEPLLVRSPRIRREADDDFGLRGVSEASVDAGTTPHYPYQSLSLPCGTTSYYPYHPSPPPPCFLLSISILVCNDFSIFQYILARIICHHSLPDIVLTLKLILV